MDLQGKRALICGASQGIGAQTATALAKAGAQVVLLARSAEKLQALQKHIGGEVVVADLAQPEALAKKLEALDPVHILVNNAGGPKAGPILEAEPVEFEAAFRTHILSAQRLVKWALPKMRADQYGRVINVISTSVKVPIANLGVSNTIRAAMANWAKTLSNELGPLGITVNNVLPGYTQTERLVQLAKATSEKTGKSIQDIEREWLSSIPLKRFAEPSETAAAIVFLASPLASYISGVNLPVDGGRTPSL